MVEVTNQLGRPAHTPLPSPSPPPVRPQPNQGYPRPELIRMAQAVSQIVATRILLLLAVVTTSVAALYTTWQPSELRIVAVGVYCVLTVWPLTWLYAKGAGTND